MLTNWNDVTTPPVNVGVYNVEDNIGQQGWSYWDGHRFGYISRKHHNAYILRNEPTIFHVERWRGTDIAPHHA